MSSDPSDHDQRQISRDRETIKKWADQHDAVPVRETSDSGSGQFRLVPKSQVSDEHEEMAWDDFHDEMQSSDSVVFYHGETADEPFEVTHRDDAMAHADMEREEFEERLLEGETITSQITETTVVESVVTETATIESELVDTEIVDQQVQDVQLQDRQCLGCNLVEDESMEHQEWFDIDRYLGSIKGTDTEYSEPMRTAVGRTETTTEDATTAETETTTDDVETETSTMTPGTTAVDLDETGVERDFPYHAELDIEETWRVSRDITERFTVESRIADTDISEAESIEDHDIDFEGLERSIAEQGLLNFDQSVDDIMRNCTIESEFHKGDRVRTHFERSILVEDDVVDTISAYADISNADLTAMETVRSEDMSTEITGDAGLTESETTTESVETTSESMDETTETTSEPMDETTETTAAPQTTEGATLTDADEGKTVVDATGDKLGTVTNVTSDGQQMTVDAHHGITDRIRSVLEWGHSDDDYTIDISQIDVVTDDEVRLKNREELEEGR